MNKFFKFLSILALAASVIAITSAASASPGQPTFVTNTVDETVFFAQTSAICGFPVFEHDVGTVTTAITTLPDDSTKAHDIAVRINVTFFSTDPSHPGTVTTRGVGGAAEIDHPDGSVTIMFHGQDGHATMSGEGLVWASIGLTKIEIDASGNVTEVQHGIFYPDHSGICPLL